MKNKYIVIALISAIIAVIIFGLVVNYNARKISTEEVMQPIPAATSELNEEFMVESTNEDALEPLPADEIQAVDSEIQAIDAELSSLMDESLDDLSDVENSF